MKFRVTMKDPDVMLDALNDEVNDELDQIEGLTGEDRNAIFGVRQDAALKVAGKFFKYSEYLTVEIDTEAQTCVVIPNV